jgi:hypothetical protein
VSEARAQVARVIRTLEPSARGGFTWFGQRQEGLSRSVWNRLSPATRRGYAVRAISDYLYAHFYCTGGPEPIYFPPSARSGAGLELEEESTSLGARRESGWRVVEVRPLGMRVAKGGLTLTVTDHEFCADNTGRVEPGLIGSLLMPKAYPRISPGYLMATGDRDLSDAVSVTRVYFNISWSAITGLKTMVGDALNLHQVPFRLKHLTDRSARRCDRVVLYTASSDWDVVYSVLSHVNTTLFATLLQRVPVFTKRIAPGIGVAEQPPGAISFGTHRCGLLAEGLVAAHEVQLQRLDKRFEAVAGAFAKGEVDLDLPHLNEGKPDRYRPIVGVTPASRPKASLAKRLNYADLVGVAHGIAREIVDTAIVANGRCTWVSPFADQFRRVHRVVGGDLYSGTAGIGLFLSEVAAATADHQIATTALSAFRHALATTGSMESHDRLGLFSGWSGIALACAEAGRILGNDFLQQRSHHLLHHLMREPVVGRADLISGHAGAIIAALNLGIRFGFGAAFDYAVRIANDLLERATIGQDSCSWRTVNEENEHDLTGISHGASGIAVALLELYAVTQERTHIDGAIGALSYERRLFNQQVGNWPDLRAIRRRDAPKELPYASFWCHGAGGITLARLHARVIAPSRGPWGEEIRAGVAAVRDWMASEHPARHANYSLCHGLAGNALVLLEAGSTPGTAPGGGRALAQFVLDDGASRYGADATSWPCAAGGGTSPGLMLGLSGIGHAYLHAAGCPVADILQCRTIRPEEA